MELGGINSHFDFVFELTSFDVDALCDVIRPMLPIDTRGTFMLQVLLNPRLSAVSVLVITGQCMLEGVSEWHSSALLLTATRGLLITLYEVL